MDVYWQEQAENDVPVENRWLSEREVLCLDAMRFAKRRADWRLGRWTAKRALAACLNLTGDLEALKRIEIRPERSGAPTVFLSNQAAAIAISISHRAGVALCSIAPSGCGLGCDLETIEFRSDAFVGDYFTANEQGLVAHASAEQRPLLVALIWSGKESALKALHLGLRADTKSVEVIPFDASTEPTERARQNPGRASALKSGSDGWQSLHALCSNAGVFHGWWRWENDMVRTIFSVVPLGSPTRLESPSRAGECTQETEPRKAKD
jgi:4'-phosphopantetheinyl transferase